MILAGILGVTLTPAAGRAFPPPCLLCSDRWLADVLRNIALFLPFGLVLGRRRSALLALAIGALLSGAIEVTQLMLPGRAPSPLDVACNAVGTMLGNILSRYWPGWVFAEGAAARRLAWAAAGSAAVAAALTAVLLGNAFPRSLWFGQWTARLSRLDHYRGRVLSADVAGLPLPSWELRASDDVRRRLLADQPLQVRALAGEQPRWLAPIFGIADDRSREILMLGAWRGDLVLRWRARARSWFLEQPDHYLRGAFAGVSPGDTIVLSARAVGPLACLAMNGRTACPRFGAGSGWQFLVPHTFFAPALRPAVDAAWAALLIIPAAFFALASGPAALLAAAAAMLAIPPLAGTGALRIIDALGIVAGLGAAIMLARLRRRLYVSPHHHDY